MVCTTPRWREMDSNSRSHPLTRRQTDGSDPPHLPTQQIYAPVEALAAVSVLQSSNAATLVSSAASAQVGGSSVNLNPMDQRPYRPIRGAARFLNSPLCSRVLRCTALPRIAYGGALTAALLLSRYVSLSLGRFHCGSGRLCEGWRTAPRHRDWWLSYGHHGRFLGVGSGCPPV